MKSFKFPFLTGVIPAVVCWSAWAQPMPPRIEYVTMISMVPLLTIQGEVGTTNVLEYADEWGTNQWRFFKKWVVTNNSHVVEDVSAPPSQRFYRVLVSGVFNLPHDPSTPTGMALIPSGLFTMGDTLNDESTDDKPAHPVYVSAFYMDKFEVTKGLWDEVCGWATNHYYFFDELAGAGKAADHPVESRWYEVVKWCNARSEKEGRVPAYYTSASKVVVYRQGNLNLQNDWVKWNAGYRLPTEAEWEKAARGGFAGNRFPWGDTISHSQANYRSSSAYNYDVSSTRGYHSDYDIDPYPYTSPVGSFAPNGYGLYDMAGNLAEWCWDWHSNAYYSPLPTTDPLGPDGPIQARARRGGHWSGPAIYCRVAKRYPVNPFNLQGGGFRTVLSPGQ